MKPAFGGLVPVDPFWAGMSAHCLALWPMFGWHDYIRDVSSYNRQSTPTADDRGNKPVYIATEHGPAMYFDGDVLGTGPCMKFALDSASFLGGSYDELLIVSFARLVATRADGSASDCAIFCGDNTATDETVLGADNVNNAGGDAALRFRCICNGTEYTSGLASGLEDGVWHIYAGYGNGTTMKCFRGDGLISGDQAGTSPYTFPTGAGQAQQVGGKSHRHDHGWAGDIGWVGVWANMGVFKNAPLQRELLRLENDPFLPFRTVNRTLHFPPQYRHVVPGRR